MIHPTAIIDPTAECDADVDVGPYAIVGAGVRLGAGTTLAPHAVILGGTTLGRKNVVGAFAVIGALAQDKRGSSEAGVLRVGDGNTFREHVTVHCGTSGPTVIGNDNLFMVASHVGHDTTVGNAVTVSNAVLLAGHVSVEDYVTLGGGAAVAQHVVLGESAFVAGGAMVERDVPPFVVVQGDRARVRGLNKVGLRRRGFDAAAITSLERALRRLLFGKETLSVRAEPLLHSSDERVARLARAMLGSTCRDR